MSALEREYGHEKGKQVFYAGKNNGTFTGVDSLLDDVSSIILEPEAIRAAGVIFVCKDKALFLQRSSEGDHAGEWCYPGGKIEDGESALEAARRECREEIGKMPKGDAVLHMRRISTGIPQDLVIDPESNPGLVKPPVDFTTFVVKVEEEFNPKLNEEHTAYTWAPIASPPQPMHPDAAFALAKFSMNEFDIALAIRDGQLVSPQQFMSIWLVDMRITGTGTSYRHRHKEFVFRNPELYLNDYFLARCNGLPVIIEHPPGDTLDTEEYRERNIGAICLPYIKGDEVWGIAKIYDAMAAQLIIENKLSTSPAVVFRPSDGNKEIEVDGAKILIEGGSSFLDHLAVCKAGVWDKGGEPSGISIRGDSIVNDVTKKADAGDVMSMLDGLRADMKECMSKMDATSTRIDAHTKRMDEDEKKREDASKADAAKKDEDTDDKKSDADEKERADKAKKDAEDEEEKKKADAAKADAAKADAAKKDGEIPMSDAARADAIKAAVDAAVQAAVTPLLGQLSELRSKVPMQRTDAQRAEFAAAQARHDVAYMSFGEQAPAPLLNEDLGDYRRRLTSGLKKHSAMWAETDLVAMKDDATFGTIEGMVIADAIKAARNPKDLPYGQLQKSVRKDDSGMREITEYHGDPRSWMDQFSGRRLMVQNINRNPDRHN